MFKKLVCHRAKQRPGKQFEYEDSQEYRTSSLLKFEDKTDFVCFQNWLPYSRQVSGKETSCPYLLPTVQKSISKRAACNLRQSHNFIFFSCFSIWPWVLLSLEENLRFLKNHGMSAIAVLSPSLLLSNPPAQLFAFLDKMCLWGLYFLRDPHWEAFKNFLCVSSVCSVCVCVNMFL